MDRDEMLKLDNQICFALYACAREVTKLYRPHLDELGLTYTQYVTLLALWEQDGVPVKALGERLYLDSGTLTPLLKKLEAAGIVRRERETSDERVVIVRLTEQGRKLKEKVYALPEKAMCQTRLDPGQLAELRDRLRMLTEDVQRDSCGGDEAVYSGG